MGVGEIWGGRVGVEERNGGKVLEWFRQNFFCFIMLIAKKKIC